MYATALPLSILALALFAPGAAAQGQDEDYGVWSAFAGQGPIESQRHSSQWRWWFDSHARFFDDTNGFQQSIIRPGVGLNISDNATAWLGYAWIYTDPAQSSGFDEHRIWQQLIWSAPLESSTFMSRSRLEQRFLETGNDVGWRLRQFLRLTRPLGDQSRHGLRLWDEVFFDLNDTDWGADVGFSQNRLFAGFGWTFGDARHFTLEYGYLNQFTPRSDAPDSMNHILSLQLLMTL